MSYSAGTAIWSLAFEKSPIMLTGGLAGPMGGMLPIIAFTEAINFVSGLLSGTNNIEMSNFFAAFQPLPGSTLINLEIGSYPFANQTVAANATIKQPRTLSMLMLCPARNALGYYAKLATMTALQQALDQHSSLGGTYTVITQSGIYTNGILTALRDVSHPESHQVQNAYQWDFVFPLLTLEQAQQAQNNLMGQLTNGTQVTGSPPAWSGTGTAINAPNSLIAPNIMPASSNLTSSTIYPAGGLT